MDTIDRKYIDFERSKSERSHPSPPPYSNYYDKNQEIVDAPAENINYPKYKPSL